VQSDKWWWNERRRVDRLTEATRLALRHWAWIGVSVWLACAPLRAAALARATSAAGVTPALEVSEHAIRRGDSLAAILSGHGVATEEIGRWRRAARLQFDLGHIEPGRVLRLEFDARGRLHRLRYPIDREHALVVERDVDERLLARSVVLPVSVRAAGVRAVVRRNLFETARQAGIPDAIIAQMVDLLSRELPFKSAVRRGDRVRVLYEQRTSLDGQPLPPGRILAVDYVGRQRSAAAYLFDTQDGAAVYVDDSGHLVNAPPLRYPLEFTRITSEFSASRFHPILQHSRPHLGIDFAAPAGTPVRAVGAGTVQWAGPQGGFGNHLELDHGGGLVSTYSHLRGIEPHVAVGTRVLRGQLLGWVGQTGWATGPHLHFAMFDHGQYVDPLTITHAPQLTAVDPRGFAPLRREMLARLQALPVSAPSAPSAPEIGLSPLAQAGRGGPINLTF
jgi:murein DD-endopeptidase MepM/ murein hydrolase activator NlpD